MIPDTNTTAPVAADPVAPAVVPAPVVTPAVVPAAPSAVKPGYKTTQFWLSLLAVLVGAVMSTGLLIPNSEAAKIIGAVAMVLTALGYQVQRTMAYKQ